MKSYVLAVVSAILLGALFSFFIFNRYEDNNDSEFVSNSYSKVKVFQLGVFKKIDNANNFSNEVGNSIVVENNQFYYVYGAIMSNDSLIKMQEEYYIDKGIVYAIKDLVVDNKFYEEIQSYETLMIQSNNIDVIIKTNKIVLDKYKDE